MTYTVNLPDSGTTLNSVSEVDFAQNFNNESTLATIIILDNTEESKIGYDEKVEIVNSNNDIEFTGLIKNIDKSSENIELTAQEQYAELIEMEANGRIAYNEDSGDFIKKLITEDVSSEGRKLIQDGDTLTDVSSTAPVFELANFRDLRPEIYGTDLIFLGFPKEETDQGEYTITYDNITPHGDEFTRLETRILANNSGVFNLYAQYIDDSGTNYIWELGNIDGVNNIELQFEEASQELVSGALDPDNTANYNKLRLIIEVNGKMIESRAIAIDGIIGKAISIENRDHNFNSIDITSTNRNITRRFTSSVSEAIYNILSEEPRTLIIDENNNVTLKTKGETDAPLEIIEGETPVINWDVNKNTDKIRNRIIVEGDNDILVEKKSLSSIQTFGFTKTKKIRDLSIQNESDARDRAEQELADLSFEDAKIIIEMPDTTELNNSETGDKIYINYKDINNTFIINEIEKTSDGWTKIKIDAESINL